VQNQPTTDASKITTVRWVLITVAIIATIGGLLAFGSRISRQEDVRRLRERRDRNLAEIKADPSDEILIYDLELLALLVADEETSVQVKSLVFTEVDFSASPIAEISRLTQLQNIGFYSCGGADLLLARLQGMPSVEKIWVETSAISADGIKLLAALPNLKHIRFEQVMSDADVELLEETLPRVNIEVPQSESAKH
jgi:hypothetical protein